MLPPVASLSPIHNPFAGTPQIVDPGSLTRQLLHSHNGAIFNINYHQFVLLVIDAQNVILGGVLEELEVGQVLEALHQGLCARSVRELCFRRKKRSLGLVFAADYVGFVSVPAQNMVPTVTNLQ